jgi:PTH1 family peptidyl-tRNA hydrolase
MILIIGLGNPGKKYELSRHSLGFLVLDSFSKKNLFEFKSSKKLKSKISKGSFGKKRVVLAKPQTFMNNSGKAVKLLVKNYKLQTTNVWVIHDDIDLSLGKIKIVKNRGSAGHKGVQSIINEMKTKNFVRFRMGINPRYKTTKQWSDEAMKKFVLKKFTKREKGIIKKVVENCVKALEITLKEGLEKAMNEFN